MKEEKTLKKFLSVLLTMAMVMSLFTGTVLAAPTAMALSKSTIVEGVDTSITVEVTGAATTSVNWKLTANGSFVSTVNTGNATLDANNKFTLDVSYLGILNTEAIKQYDLYVEDAAVVLTAGSLKDTITVRHAMSINGATTAPVVKLNESTTFSGVITNGKNLYVAILLGGVSQMATQTDANGVFSFSRTFTMAGNYTIGVGTTMATYNHYMDIDFAPAEDMKVVNTTVPTTTRDTVPFATTVTIAPKTSNDAALSGAVNTLFVEITEPDGDLVKMTSGALYTATVNLAALPAGTYTVTAVLFNNDVSAKAKLSDIKRADGFIALRKAVGTFVVSDNTSVLVPTVQAGEYTPAPASTWTANADTTKYTQVIPTTETHQAVKVFLSAPLTKEMTKVVYTVSGPMKASVSKTITTGFSAAAVANTLTSYATFDLINGGTVTVSGTVTYSDKTTETFEKTLTVNGFVVVFNDYELGSVGDEITLSTTVKTTGGTPVNNARVEWVPSVATFRTYNSTDKVYNTLPIATNLSIVDGKLTNIIDGVYAMNVKLAAFATVDYIVYDKTNTLVYAESQGVIYGDDVYTATVTGTLVATIPNQELTIKLFDANGVAVTPTTIQVDELGDVDLLTEVSFTGIALTSGKIKLNPTKTGTFNLLIGTDSGKKMVVVPVTIVAPAATVAVGGNDSSVVTAGIREKVVVTFENVTTGTITVSRTGVIDATAALVANTNDTGIFAAVNDVNSATTIAVANKTATFYVDVLANRDSATRTISLSVLATGGNGSAVKFATLTVAPIVVDTDGVTSLVVDATTDLNLTVTDARGNALEAYTVVTSAGTLAGNNTATTDVDGKASLSVRPVTVGTLELSLNETSSFYFVDKNSVTQFPTALKTLTIGRDVTGPVVVVEDVYVANTSSYSGSFSLSDTSKITDVYIDDVKVNVRPDNTVRFTVTGLVPGVNEFEVLAYDIEGNGTIATLVIEYLKPSTVVLTIGSEDATKDGVAMTGMDQAPMIVNGRTFLPVRFVFVNLLGGTIQWDATTQTITSVVNGNTIKMVIGSKTAYVNGNVVTLLEAPFIEPSTSRTLVPMREIMEAIGISLDWNVTNQTVTLTIPQ